MALERSADYTLALEEVIIPIDNKRDKIRVSDEDYTPSDDEDYTPSDDEDYTPSDDEDYTPSDDEDYTPSDDEDYTPSDDEDYTPSDKLNHSSKKKTISPVGGGQTITTSSSDNNDNIDVFFAKFQRAFNNYSQTYTSTIKLSSEHPEDPPTSALEQLTDYLISRYKRKLMRTFLRDYLIETAHLKHRTPTDETLNCVQTILIQKVQALISTNNPPSDAIINKLKNFSDLLLKEKINNETRVLINRLDVADKRKLKLPTVLKQALKTTTTSMPTLRETYFSLLDEQRSSQGDSFILSDKDKLLMKYFLCSLKSEPSQKGIPSPVDITERITSLYPNILEDGLDTEINNLCFILSSEFMNQPFATFLEKIEEKGKPGRKLGTSKDTSSSASSSASSTSLSLKRKLGDPQVPTSFSKQRKPEAPSDEYTTEQKDPPPSVTAGCKEIPSLDDASVDPIIAIAAEIEKDFDVSTFLTQGILVTNNPHSPESRLDHLEIVPFTSRSNAI